MTAVQLCFDVDGTLTDPREGITGAINFALARLGQPARDPAWLTRFIGLGIDDAFRALLDTDDPDLLARAVAAYREHYFDRGWRQNVLYPAVPAMLRACEAAGHRLFVVTMKRQAIAARVLAHFGLDTHFAGVYGGDIGRAKGDILAAALRAHRLDPAACLMIGDRRQDIDAGRACGVRTVGVLWGFGDRDELAGADVLISRPDELLPAMAHLADR